MATFYLYHHIREDTNDVFYVGIGKIYSKKGSYKFFTEKSKYSRAYYINNRNPFWKNIISKTKYHVKIILHSKNLEFIKKKEIQHILLYGRKDLGNGTLTNLTDGGEGVFNCSEETRAKMRNHKIGKSSWNKGKKGCQIAWNKGKKMPKEFGIKCTKNAHISLMKKCYIYDLNGDIVKQFIQIRDMIIFFKVKNLNYYLDKFIIYREKFILSTKIITKEDVKLKSKKPSRKNVMRRIALVDDNNNIIKKFESIKEATLFHNVSYTYIHRSIIGYTKKSKKGKWIRI